MTEKPHILVVEDEPAIRLTLETGLSLKGFRVSSAESGRKAAEVLQKQQFDLILCDVLMPDGDGLSVVRKTRALDSDLPIILMTAQGSVETAVKAVAEGATDFIAKPFEIAALAVLVNRHLDAQREKWGKIQKDEQNLLDEFSKTGLVGRSQAMVAVYKLIAFAARTDATVLVTGETGTGKELVARAVHNFSERASKKFVSVNCAGLTDTLLEAELFGYEKGAFTGANASRAGLFEAANGGTILLDELASTSAMFQASLLRVLQSGEVRPVGSTETKRVDVRVIGASNQNLFEFAAAGKFRHDLYYRLSVLTIELPPLRERRGDVSLLTAHFLRRTAQNKTGLPHLSAEVLDVLDNYDFPGNVRELENSLIRAVALATNNVVTLDCLPLQIAAQRTAKRFSDDTQSLIRLAGDRPTLEELERRYLELILLEVNGNRRRAAAQLGVARRTIQRLIARYSLSAVAESETEEEADEAE